METCGTCGHWTAQFVYSGRGLDRSVEYCYCALTATDDNGEPEHPDSLAIAKRSDTYWDGDSAAHLITDADFGCIEWVEDPAAGGTT